MDGLLGTRAGLQADLNLIFQVVIFLLLVVGYVFAKRRNMASHGRIMNVVAALNLFSILAVMGPSVVINLFPLLIYYPTIGTTTLIHALTGGFAAALGTTWGFRKFRNIKMWMRVTSILWLLGFVLGIANYVLGYVL